MNDEKPSLNDVKNVLKGNSCNICKFFDTKTSTIPLCLFINPIKIKYPNDVQVFIDGRLVTNFGSNNIANAYFITDENNLIINQNNILNIYAIIEIYSRGFNDNGEYELDHHIVNTLQKEIHKNNICKFFIKKENI